MLFSHGRTGTRFAYSMLCEALAARSSVVVSSDLLGAGHQAASDIVLYAELAHRIPDLPDLVRQYLQSTAAESGAPGAPAWRTQARVQVAATSAFLDTVLGLDPEAGAVAVERLENDPDVVLRRR